MDEVEGAYCLAYYTCSQSFLGEHPQLQLPLSASVAHVIQDSTIYTPAKNDSLHTCANEPLHGN